MFSHHPIVAWDSTYIFGQKSLDSPRTPTYSPDLAPSDFFLFPKCNGYSLGTIMRIKAESLHVLKEIPVED